ncbi:ABC transporter substrate-binding protein [Roseomonas gilardii subsp. gilardii]|uniref:ABC transporter substrate-binding protein n=1 Tax=Roseomonas gilardii TaxID=257708 RepID=UPI001FF771B7|nr:ABC transporter substrate-binding protein [Roseomonas gilardii]UPG73812.1 ABC transporter substrate-binding protein [Roseomonas gilardii subsp. gilardii]
MRQTLRTALLGSALAVSALMPVAGAWAQAAPRDTLVALREIDADNYDPARTTSQSAGWAIYMMADTLVSMDWDQKTVKPGLAESWTVSPDGRLYTFKLKQGVKFCDGKPMTAKDVVYSINRWIDPATRSPSRWRAGQVKEVRAVDDYTVEYELKEPFSELLLQLTMYFASIVDQGAVEKLGQNFGVQGFNGTGPYCWGSWTPRQDLVLNRHDGYNWGPPIYKNPSPQIGKVIWRVMPEANTRLAALQTGQADVTQDIPLFAIEGLKKVPTVKLTQQPVYFWDVFVGFKVDKPVVSDPAIREAVNMAVNRAPIAKAVYFDAASPADALLNPKVQDFNPATLKEQPKFDIEGAKKLLDEAGWKVGSDGIREKNGQRASFLLYGIQSTLNSGGMQAMQSDLRRVGIDMKIQLWDATVAWGKLATQEFDAFTMSYPYLSATDALSLYFPSANRPTPNRMNWANEETDRNLMGARTATDPAERARMIGEVQEQLTGANVWVPLVRQQLWLLASQRVEGARPHGIYGAALYKGLDIRLTR